MLIKKISQIKKFCSHIKKVCFYQNKIRSHIQKSIRLRIQKTHGKQPQQILTANSRSKFLWKIPMVISHGNFLRQIPTANSHGKFSQQIATANSCCKQPRQILAANSHGKFSNMQYKRWCRASSVWESFTREDKKKTSNKAKAMRINPTNQ